MAWLARGGVSAGFAGVWAYPIAGGIVGGIGAGVFAACARLGLPATLAATLSVAGMVLASGALHEDGLADTADGFGGGRTREHKLAIMRDSRIGSFGALALILGLAVRATALAALAPGRAAVALVVAATLARAAILVPLLALAPARADGLAAGLGVVPSGRATVGLAIAAAAALALLPAPVALRAACAAVLATLGMTWLARRQVGGYTGDVLGACCVVAECAALAAMAAAP